MQFSNPMRVVELEFLLQKFRFYTIQKQGFRFISNPALLILIR